MPIVSMRFVQHARPTAVPDSLVEFLRNEAGMDSAEAVKSAQHLVRGKDIEIHFDLGENEAAEMFSDKLSVWGLEGKIRSDTEIEKSDGLRVSSLGWGRHSFWV